MAGAFVPAACVNKRRFSLYNWGDYIAHEVIEAFVAAEATRGSKLDVIEDFYLSEAEMAAKLRAKAEYDAVFPIDYLVHALSRDGSLRQLELTRLPGIANLAPEFQPWEDDSGRAFAVPYLWGTTGIGYDSDKIDPPPNSWTALFDPKYAGRISVIDSKGDVMDQALLAAGLGINSNDKGRLRDEIWPMLQDQKDLLRAYDSNPARALVAGDTWIAQIDSGDLLRAQASKPSLRYVIPKEGAALWIDYVAIPMATREPELALRFIEHLLDPAMAATNANTLHFATPNRAAREAGLIVAEHDENIYPAPDVMKRLQKSENWLGQTGELVDEMWLDLRGG